MKNFSYQVCIFAMNSLIKYCITLITHWGKSHSGAKIPVHFSRDIFTNLMLYWGGCLMNIL